MLATAIAVPPSCTDREPTVSPPLRISSVSPCSTVIRSIGTPVRSDTIIAHVVTWPCPYGVVPVRTIRLPSGCSSTAPNSDPPTPDVIST